MPVSAWDAPVKDDSANCGASEVNPLLAAYANPGCELYGRGITSFRISRSRRRRQIVSTARPMKSAADAPKIPPTIAPTGDGFPDWV